MDARPDLEYYDPRTIENPDAKDHDWRKLAGVEKRWISDCDLLFAYIDNGKANRYGSVAEATWAASFEKGIILVNEKQDHSLREWLPFFINPELFTDSFEEALEYFRLWR